MRPRAVPTANRRLTPAILVVAALLGAAACDEGDDPAADTVAPDASTVPVTAPTTAPTTAAPGSTVGVVSQADAERAALHFIGEGQVTFVTPEDDRGAAWEIEITRPDGSEVDVLIAPDGTVID